MIPLWVRTLSPSLTTLVIGFISETHIREETTDSPKLSFDLPTHIGVSVQMHARVHTTLSYLIKKCNFLINSHIKPNTPSRLVCHGFRHRVRVYLPAEGDSPSILRIYRQTSQVKHPAERNSDEKRTQMVACTWQQKGNRANWCSLISPRLFQSGEGTLQAHLQRLLYFILPMGAFTSLKIIGFLLIICNLNISLNSRIQYYDCFLSA